MRMDLRSILGAPSDTMLQEPSFSLSDGTIVPEDEVASHVEVFPMNGVLDSHIEELESKSTEMDNALGLREAILTVNQSSMESNQKKKVLKLLGDNLNSFLERRDRMEYALESYHEPIESTLNKVSTEGFVDVLKAIWNAIKALVVGIYRAIVDFFKSLFGVEKKTENLAKETKKELEYVKKNGSKFDPEEAEDIKSDLLDIINLTFSDSENQELIVSRASNIIGLYKRHLNTSILPFIESTHDTIIKPIDTILKGITQKTIDVSLYELVVEQYNRIITGLNSMSDGIFQNVISPATLPEGVYDKLFNKIDMDKVNIEVRALTPVNDPDQELARKFNVFTVVDKSIRNIEDLVSKGKEEPVFNFSSFKFKNENSSKELLKPIDNVELLSRLENILEDSDDDVKINKLGERVKRVSESIVRTTDYVAARGHIDIERLQTIGRSEANYLGFISMLIYTLETTDNEVINVLRNYKGNKFANLFLDQASFTKLFMDINKHGHEAVVRSLYKHMPREIEELAKATRNEVVFHHYGILAREADERLFELDPKVVEKYKDLDKLLDKLLRSSLTNFNKALGMLGVDYASTYTELRTALTLYLNQSVKQHVR